MQKSRSRALVNSFASEPTVLWAEVSPRSDRIVVSNEAGSHSLNLPARSVFEFDGELAERLQKSFLDGDGITLNDLWEIAVPAARRNVLH